MSLKEKIEKDTITALKAGESDKVKTLRMISATIKDAAIAKKEALEEDEILTLLQREIKKRKEASDAFEKGGRKELAEAEMSEAELLQQYLPEPLSDEELENIIHEVIKATGADSVKDMGKVMNQVMAKSQGKAEGKIVSEKVKQLLS